MDILIAGVGGQGTLLTSRILGDIAVNAGYDVKISEVHGMAQRGGSVVTHVRWGEEVASPLVDAGCTDILLAFELMEAARWAHYLKKIGKLFVNTTKIPPMPVILGTAEYGENILNDLTRDYDVTALDAKALALAAGNAKALNVVMLGVLSKRLEFDAPVWLEALERVIPAKLLALNLKAFELGVNA